MTPTLAECDWLAQSAAQRPIRDALARIRYNDTPYPTAAWIEALEAAILSNPGDAGTYATLIARIRPLSGVTQ